MIIKPITSLSFGRAYANPFLHYSICNLFKSSSSPVIPGANLGVTPWSDSHMADTSTVTIASCTRITTDTGTVAFFVVDLSAETVEGSDTLVLSRPVEDDR